MYRGGGAFGNVHDAHVGVFAIPERSPSPSRGVRGTGRGGTMPATICPICSTGAGGVDDVDSSERCQRRRQFGRHGKRHLCLGHDLHVVRGQTPECEFR